MREAILRTAAERFDDTLPRLLAPERPHRNAVMAALAAHGGERPASRGGIAVEFERLRGSQADLRFLWESLITRGVVPEAFVGDDLRRVFYGEEVELVGGGGEPLALRFRGVRCTTPQDLALALAIAADPAGALAAEELARLHGRRIAVCDESRSIDDKRVHWRLAPPARTQWFFWSPSREVIMGRLTKALRYEHRGEFDESPGDAAGGWWPESPAARDPVARDDGSPTDRCFWRDELWAACVAEATWDACAEAGMRLRVPGPYAGGETMERILPSKNPFAPLRAVFAQGYAITLWEGLELFAPPL